MIGDLYVCKGDYVMILKQKAHSNEQELAFRKLEFDDRISWQTPDNGFILFDHFGLQYIVLSY